jgi:hypothetical protein
MGRSEQTTDFVSVGCVGCRLSLHVHTQQRLSITFFFFVVVAFFVFSIFILYILFITDILSSRDNCVNFFKKTILLSLVVQFSCCCVQIFQTQTEPTPKKQERDKYRQETETSNEP